MKDLIKHVRPFIIVGFLLGIIICSCATFQGTKEQWINMTPKEHVTWMLGVYNAQYNDYMLILGYEKSPEGKWEKKTNPILSEAKKNMLREKKKILTEVYPLITLYDAFVSINKIPNQETERRILDLLEKLLLMV